MSKKKNTLKDLDDFLKQQAATLVSPSRLQENLESPEIQEPETQEPAAQQAPVHGFTSSDIIEGLKQLSSTRPNSFRQEFYDIIIQILETQPQSLPEDKMLINTALYLKHGERWKEAIRAYWRTKN